MSHVLTPARLVLAFRLRGELQDLRDRLLISRTVASAVATHNPRYGRAMQSVFSAGASGYFKQYPDLLAYGGRRHRVVCRGPSASKRGIFPTS